MKKSIKWNWDMVIVLPNPDYGSGSKRISYEDALERFQKTFKPEKLSSPALTDKQR